jgi:CheY-like chemotaxis protein
MRPMTQMPIRRNCILIVEDDSVQQAVLKSALASRGYVVEVASDGLDAVRKIREGRYDLALLDYHLPEINGLATATLIRDFMGEAARPVLLALTAFPNDLTDTRKESETAFDGIIAKPIRLPDLISAVEGCLNSASNRTTRQAGQDALLETNWAEYDAASDLPSMWNDRPRPPRILVVEDDDPQQGFLRSALEASGYMVETVSDGIEGVRMIRTGAYDLVLMDYLLPEIDGLAAAQLILDSMNEDVRPQMIGLTGAADQLNGRQVRTGSVFDEVVAKSAGLPALLAVVTRRLRAAPNSATRRAAEVVRERLAQGEVRTR